MKGIYIIVNIKNHKFYLGSSKTLEQRWRQHKWELSNNKHCNPRLQNAWNKYGCDSFTFEIIERLSTHITDNDLLLFEQIYIDLLNVCDDSIGYNISPKANGGWRGVDSSIMKSVNQYTLDGCFIKKWKSAGEVLSELGYRIYDCLYHRQQSSRGFVWCFENETPTFHKKYGVDVWSTPIAQYTKQGEFVKQWKSIAEAQKTLNINGLWDAINGYRNRKSAKGFIWKVVPGKGFEPSSR